MSRRLPNSSAKDCWWRSYSVSKVIRSHLYFLAAEASQADHGAAAAASAAVAAAAGIVSD